MNHVIASRPAATLPRTLLGMLCATLLLGSAQAKDPELPEILVSAPSTRIVGRNADLTPIERVTIKAHVAFDPATLINEAGVKKLQQRVLEGARRACGAAEPGEIDRRRRRIVQRCGDPAALATGMLREPVPHPGQGAEVIQRAHRRRIDHVLEHGTECATGPQFQENGCAGFPAAAHALRPEHSV
jgi:UrcA family protein